MIHRGPAVAAMVALACSIGGCGGSQDAADRDAYATQVASISTRTGERLATLSDRSDYREASAAARSTRDYAVSIRDAARELERAKPPEAVAALHRSLITLYVQTATSLERLASQFADAQDSAALAELAQTLSSEVQRYASQEQQLRGSIERALGGASPQP